MKSNATAGEISKPLTRRANESEEALRSSMVGATNAETACYWRSDLLQLAPHALALSGGSLAVVLSQNAASATVPIPLVISTVKAATTVAAGGAATVVVSAKVAAALTEGVVKTMFLPKLKIVRVPDEAGLGKAKVTFSFAGWKEGNVAPSTVALPVEKPQPAKKAEGK